MQAGQPTYLPTTWAAKHNLGANSNSQASSTLGRQVNGPNGQAKVDEVGDIDSDGSMLP